MAGQWHAAVLRWRELAADLDPPDPHAQYLLLQTLVGAWPIDLERLEAYLEKALREAKLRTSWVDQDHGYEAGVKRHAAALLAHRPFLDDFEPFAARVAAEGRRAALCQLLLKLTSPGVPDVYQGDELEALSLVDPDNRRPVDWARRRAALDHLRAGGAPRDFGERKLDLIVRALDLRARRPEAFDERGDYEPVDAGPGVCAFVRGGAVLVVAPVRAWADAVVRRPASLVGPWRSVIEGGEHVLGADAPVSAIVGSTALALLER
jgi:(1->4)-alpha-D-glucan 1-alpha-D-glucosylmutase